MPSTPSASRASPNGFVWLLPLIALIAVAYHNSLSGPFVFDDAPAIVDNASVHQLSLATLSPPPDEGQTVGGRPVVNLTLALNYASGGTNPRGYHVFNLFVHACAACTLFGLVRRTLLSSRLRTCLSDSANAIAFAVAALWAVHPLLTESVTYIVQRAESLMGLFYLLTLYAFVRAAGAAACLLGMATKEVMAAAPVVALLYDRTFLAASWREVWRLRWRLHAALLSTWVLLGWLVYSSGGRGGTAGLGVGDSSRDYLLIQCGAIVHYLRLALWPNALAFDYGMHHDASLATALPRALLLLGLVGVIVFAWRRHRGFAFLGLTFFALLAPSSSFVPIAVQPIAEHRMYLPAAIVATVAVIGASYCFRRTAPWLVGLAIAALVSLTIARNATYRSELALWNDTIARQPRNARAYAQLADALATGGRPESALPYYAKALELESAATQPGGRTVLTEILINMGNALLATGHRADATQAYRRAVERDPNSKTAHYNLGSVLLETGDLTAAADELEAAVRLDPNYVAARTNLGAVRLQQERAADALLQFDAAARLDPTAQTHTNRGLALARLDRRADAIAACERALSLDPAFMPALDLLAQALWVEHQREAARAVLNRMLALDPDEPRARELRARWASEAP